MKSLKILIPAFVVFLSACGTSRMMQSTANSGDDVYYSSSSVETQPSSTNNSNEIAQSAPGVQQSVTSPSYSTTDADNEQIVTSSGDNTQDQDRSTVDSSGNTYVNNNYYGSGYNSPYNSAYGQGYGYNNNYGYNNYGSNYGFGGGYSPFGFSPGLSLSFGMGFGSPFYSGFSSFYNPFYSPYYSPFYSPFYNAGYYSPYGYGYGYGYGSNYNGYGYPGNDYNYGNSVSYAKNYTGIRTSPGTNSTVHVARTPIQHNPGNKIINNGNIIQPRENSNGIKVMGNNGNGIMQNQSNGNVNRPSIQLQNNTPPAPHQEFQQARPAPANTNVPHQNQSAQIKSSSGKNENRESGAFMERVARQNNLGKQDRQLMSDNSNKSFNWNGNRNSSSGDGKSGGDRKPHL